MTPGQRRALWLCVFAMTFIFWYEASGWPLLRQENIPQRLLGEAARRHFKEQFGFGAVFLAIGAALTLVSLRKREIKSLHWGDGILLAVLLGILIGVAWWSWREAMG